MVVGLCFNLAHGSNVVLQNDRRVARRFRSFANGIAFSHRPLTAGETFLFEIEEQEIGWAGHVRCGITLHNPKKVRTLPQYLLPDFAQQCEGKTSSWVFAIKPSEEMPFGDDFNGVSIDFSNKSIEEKDLVHNQQLNNNLLKAYDNILPTDIGSRIGIQVSLKGELFFFINGKRYGPCAADVPIEYEDVFAVVDLYGVTKQIRVVQVKVPTLEEFCGDIVKRHLSKTQISSLDLPAKIVERLQTL